MDRPPIGVIQGYWAAHSTAGHQRLGADDGLDLLAVADWVRPAASAPRADRPDGGYIDLLAVAA